MKRLFPFAIAAIVAACGQGQTPAQNPDQAADPSVETPKQDSASPQAGAAGYGSFDTSFAGQPAPDVALEIAADGKTETVAQILAANPGKPVLVNLWATWCAPCLKELPTLDQLAGETAGKLTVVPVSQDMEGWKKVSEAFTKAKYPNLVTRVESGMQYGFQIKAQGLPVTILYDTNGLEVWRYAGDRDWSSAESRAKMGL